MLMDNGPPWGNDLLHLYTAYGVVASIAIR